MNNLPISRQAKKQKQKQKQKRDNSLTAKSPVPYIVITLYQEILIGYCLESTDQSLHAHYIYYKNKVTEKLAECNGFVGRRR